MPAPPELQLCLMRINAALENVLNDALIPAREFDEKFSDRQKDVREVLRASG
jgi:hypothetical protein